MGDSSPERVRPEEVKVDTSTKRVDELEAGKVQEARQDVALAYRYPEYKPDKNLISAAVPPPPFYVRRVGRMYVLREKVGEDGLPELLCVVGPCWPMICVTFGLIVGISCAVFFGFMPGIPVWLVSLFALCLFVTLVSFFLTACRDPGIQRIAREKVDDSWTFSEYAQSYRQPGVIYEHEAQVLIKDIDHFCPWTGTIIAKRNMRSFNLFTSSLCALILLTIVIAAFMVIARNT